MIYSRMMVEVGSMRLGGLKYKPQCLGSPLQLRLTDRMQTTQPGLSVLTVTISYSPGFTRSRQSGS